jgi:hypothetical protein
MLQVFRHSIALQMSKSTFLKIPNCRTKIGLHEIGG